ncbi:hypothetical protein C3L33_22240, partial [Rhododendron williamsianum]
MLIRFYIVKEEKVQSLGTGKNGTEFEHPSSSHGSPKMSLQWSLNPEISGAFITGGNAKSGHPVVMRFLVAGIVIMKRRTHWTLIPFVGTTFRDMKLKWSYAPNVALSKMSNKIALAVEFAWGSTFARNANSSTMMFQRTNTTVMDVEFAGEILCLINEDIFLRCRTGGKENFFHCNKCGCCYSNVIQDSHHCVERAMHHNCPVCFEFLFDTMKEVTVLPCGHTIHLECVKEMELHFRYGSSVTIVEKHRKFISTLSHTNAKNANHTIPDRYREALLLLAAPRGLLRLVR